MEPPININKTEKEIIRQIVADELEKESTQLKEKIDDSEHSMKEELGLLRQDIKSLASVIAYSAVSICIIILLSKMF